METLQNETLSIIYLDFLYFSDNKNEPDKTDENYSWLWQMRAIFDKFNDSRAKYYSPTKHLAADEINCALQSYSHLQTV